MNCGIAKTINYFESYVIRARMLHTVCSNNFVRSTAVEPATTVRRHLISYATGTKGRSEARVRSLLAEMQSCTLQPGEDPNLCFSRRYRLRLQLQQVGCTLDDYKLKANASSRQSAEYIPMLNQLCNIQSLDLTMVNKY